MAAETVDLELGPATQVAPREFSVRVDGLPPEQAESIRRRVAKTLQQRWDTATAAPERAPAQPDASARHGAIEVVW